MTSGKTMVAWDAEKAAGLARTAYRYIGQDVPEGRPAGAYGPGGYDEALRELIRVAR